MVLIRKTTVRPRSPHAGKKARGISNRLGSFIPMMFHFFGPHLFDAGLGGLCLYRFRSKGLNHNPGRNKQRQCGQQLSVEPSSAHQFFFQLLQAFFGCHGLFLSFCLFINHFLLLRTHANIPLKPFQFQPYSHLTIRTVAVALWCRSGFMFKPSAGLRQVSSFS